MDTSRHFDGSTSQLEASGDTVVENRIEEVEAGREVDAVSLGSDESLVIVQETSTPQQPAADIELEAVEVVENPQQLDLPVLESQGPENVQESKYQAPQWFSSLESTINRELLGSEEQPSSQAASQHALGVVEAEDDDLYGPPPDIAKADGKLVSVAAPESPPDVLDQFLQLAPATIAGPSMSFEANGASNAPSTPLRQNERGIVTKAIQPEKVTVPIFSKRSPVTYPEPQSPFRQNRDQQTSSSASSRHSSGRPTRLQSLDGAVDESEPFADYINHLSQIAATVESPQHLPAAVKPSPGDTEKGMKKEVDVTLVGETEDTLQIQHAAASADELSRRSDQTMTIDTHQVTDQLPSSELTESPNQETAKDAPSEPVQGRGTHAQLPTPDQTQIQRLTPELDAESLARASRSTGGESTSFTSVHSRRSCTRHPRIISWHATGGRDTIRHARQYVRDDRRGNSRSFTARASHNTAGRTCTGS